MQKCYNCGKEVSDETLICPECGALVKRYTTPARRLEDLEPMDPDEPQEDAPSAADDDGYANMFSGQTHSGSWKRPGGSAPYSAPNEPQQRTPYSAPYDPEGRAQYSAPQTGYDRQEVPMPGGDARPRGSVWRDNWGRAHFRAGLTIWLVVWMLLSGYLAFGFGCTQFVYHNQDLYFSMLDSMPELADMESMIHDTMTYVSEYQGIFLALFIGNTGLFASILWLLASKRRAALYTVLGMFAALTAATVFQLFPIAIVTAFGGLVTFFWLRKKRSLLR